MRISAPRSATRPPRPYASQRFINLLAQMCLAAALFVPLGAVTYAINAGTRAGGDVVVEVDVRDWVAMDAALAAGPRPGARVDGAGASRTELRAWDSTLAEQLLSRAGVALLGVCVGLGALLLARMLRSVAAGEPFHAANAGRAATIAGLVMAGGLASTWLPVVAADAVPRRVELAAGPYSPVDAPAVQFSLPHLLAAALLLVLAEVFRRGHADARDLDGLV